MPEIEGEEEIDFELAVKCTCTICGGECLADEPDSIQAWCENCRQTVEVKNPLLE